MPRDLPPFGAILKDIRHSLGISQSDLAHVLGSTQRHVSFLETGRSHPTAGFVTRICRELKLSVAQRANLYFTSGHIGPYTAHDPASDEVTAALDMIEARLLDHWPFPGLVLDARWNVLRANGPFRTLFAPFIGDGNAEPNLLEVFLSPQFRGLVTNWNEAVGILYFRLQAAAAKDAGMRDIYLKARRDGVFPDDILSRSGLPIFVPIRIAMPDCPEIEISSLLGKLASTQDALIDGFEVELMVPVTEASEKTMAALLGGT